MREGLSQETPPHPTTHLIKDHTLGVLNAPEACKGCHVGQRCHQHPVSPQAIGCSGQQVHQLHCKHDPAAHIVQGGSKGLQAVGEHQQGKQATQGDIVEESTGSGHGRLFQVLSIHRGCCCGPSRTRPTVGNTLLVHLKTRYLFFLPKA